MLRELSVTILFDPARICWPLHVDTHGQSTFIFLTVGHEVEIQGTASLKDFAPSLHFHLCCC